MTKILSASMMVASRWATMITVQSWNRSLSILWMKLSVSKSTFAVASSRTKIFVFLIMALARQTSYFWPAEKRLLLSET